MNIAHLYGHTLSSTVPMGGGHISSKVPRTVSNLAEKARSSKEIHPLWFPLSSRRNISTQYMFIPVIMLVNGFLSIICSVSLTHTAGKLAGFADSFLVEFQRKLFKTFFV